jgi:hypothetical protein
LRPLGGSVQKICNKGPDLSLSDGSKLELKAATDLDWIYILRGLEYDAPCLFSGDGNGGESLSRNDHDDFEVIGCEFFSDGAGQWIVGLLSPRQSQEKMLYGAYLLGVTETRQPRQHLRRL